MAFAQGLIETIEKQNRELEELFDSDLDFFELYRKVDKRVGKRLFFLLGYHHNFGRETEINSPTLNELIDVWHMMKEWKDEIEYERRNQS